MRLPIHQTSNMDSMATRGYVHTQRLRIQEWDGKDQTKTQTQTLPVNKP